MVKEVFDRELFNHFACHITQSWQWGEFRRETPSIKTVLRLGSYTDGELTKVWQILFSKLPYLSSYSVGYLPRGPLPNSEELEEIKKFCRKENAIFLKVEPVGSLQSTDSNSAKREISARQGISLPNTRIGKSILPQHTIYVDLTVSEERLLAQMHEKTRYNIRLAVKKGVIIREENSTEGLEKFINILEDTEKRQGFYSHNSDYYRKLWRSLQPAEMVHLLNAYVEGKEAAGIMLFKFKDFLYYPYGGSDYELRQFMAPQLLHFEAMKLGKKLGCKTYDLWGSYLNSPHERDPWWGFYRLKSGLGGKEVDFPQSIDVPLSPLYQPLMLADSFRWFLLKSLKRLK